MDKIDRKYFNEDNEKKNDKDSPINSSEEIKIINLKKNKKINVNHDEEDDNLLKNFIIKLLTIKKDYLWQDIIKEIYNIDKNYKINNIISDINLTQPYNSFLIFKSQKYEEKRNNNNNNKITITFEEMEKEIKKEWSEKTENEKIKYREGAKKLRNIYLKNLAVINKYLFMGNDFINKTKLTEYNLYLRDEIIKNYKNDKTIDEIKLEAENNWKNNENYLQKNYNDIKEKITKYNNILNKIEKIEGIDIFTKDKIEKYKLYNKKYIKKQWKKLSDKERMIYNNNAMIKNLKNEVLLNIKEIILNKLKKKKRKYPMDIFKGEIKELYGKHINIENLWNKLDEDIKQLYINKCKRINLIIEYKSLIFKKNNKKIYSVVDVDKENNCSHLNNESNKNKKITIKKKRIINKKMNEKNENKVENNKNLKKLDIKEEQKHTELNGDNNKNPNIIEKDSQKINEYNIDNIEQNNNIETIENKNIKKKVKKERERYEDLEEEEEEELDLENNYNYRIYSKPQEPLTAFDKFFKSNKNYIRNIYHLNDEEYKKYIKFYVELEWNKLEDRIKEQYLNIEEEQRYLYQRRLFDYKKKGYYEPNKTIKDYQKMWEKQKEKIEKEMNKKLNINEKTGLIKPKKEKKID